MMGLFGSVELTSILTLCIMSLNESGRVPMPKVKTMRTTTVSDTLSVEHTDALYQQLERAARVCANHTCSETFTPVRKDQRFHSVPCRLAYYATFKLHACPECGVMHKPTVRMTYG